MTITDYDSDKKALTPADRRAGCQGDWMLTYTGRQFFPFAPRAADVDLHDIAHALANMCRYAGHTRQFYSVAQHAVLVSNTIFRDACRRVADPDSHEVKLTAADNLAERWALLHDAAEAYLQDVIRPLKKCMYFDRPANPGWPNSFFHVNEVEEKVERAVAERFGFAWADVERVASVVKAADNALLMTERRDLMSDKGPAWHKWAEPLEERIEDCWLPAAAQKEFLQRAAELGIK